MGRKFDSLLSSIRYRIPVAQPTLNTSQLLGRVQKGALLSFESGERGVEGLLTEQRLGLSLSLR